MVRVGSLMSPPVPGACAPISLPAHLRKTALPYISGLTPTPSLFSHQIFTLYSKYSQTYEAIFETKVKVRIPNPNNTRTSCLRTNNSMRSLLICISDTCTKDVVLEECLKYNVQPDFYVSRVEIAVSSKYLCARCNARTWSHVQPIICH